jgi:SH3-like domain-containing protein
MKKLSMMLCLVLALIYALPTIAGAETQQEFELRCYKKTVAATDVYDFRYKAEGEVIDHIPAGTYVIIHSSGEWYYITYMINVLKKSGSVKVGFVDTASVVRRSDGIADLVHEKDPEYSAKIKQGTLEFDVTQYDDKMEYAAYKAGLAPEPARKSDAASSKSTPNADHTTAEIASETDQNDISVGVLELGLVYSKISYNGQPMEVATADLVFGENIPEGKELAVIYAPNTGRASLRKSASENATVLKTCKAGVIVSVIEVGKTYTKVNYKGTIGYVKNSSLQFYSAASQDTATGKLSYKGKTNGATTVNVRCKADKESVVVATWETGTAVRILSTANGWYEIEAKGIHGWVLQEYLTKD